MGIAADPWSDPVFPVFLSCAAFSGSFLLIAAVSGALHGHGHGHSDHFGHLDHGHGVHIDHGAHGGHGVHIDHGVHLDHGAHGGHGPDMGHGGHGGHGPHLDHGAHGGHGPHLDHGAHGDGQGHEVGQRGQGARGGPAGAGMVVAHRRGAWSGFSSLLMSSLSVYGLLIFLFHFGVTGIVVISLSRYPAPFLEVLLATLIGVTATLAWSAVLGRLFGDTSGLVTRENSSIEGRQVRVTRAIRQGGTGEVRFTPPGGVFQSIPARSIDGQAIPVGQTVRVVIVRRGIALVRRLDRLADADADADAGVDAEGCEDNEAPS